MAEIRPPTSEHRSFIEDSRRWRGFEHRPDDVIISTPPKSGTTWMQGIVSSLLWPAGDAPGDLNERSPWLDARYNPIDRLLAHLDAQQHRRFIKTHAPADCVPIFEDCKYIAVYRDGRDALMSWANHRAAMRPEFVEFLNSTAVDEGISPMPPTWGGDMDELLTEWSSDSSSIRHLASWWPLRKKSFVCFVHYNDLKSDLGQEMRRIAEFLGIEVAESLWPEVIDRCGLTRMRDDADGERLSMIFEGGADSFFHKGTNGRWRDVLTPAQVRRYEALVAERLSEEAAGWLEGGSSATGSRPDQI